MSICVNPINAMINQDDCLSSNEVNKTKNVKIKKPKKICNQKRRLEDTDYREPSIDYSSKIKKELGDDELYLCLLGNDSNSDNECLDNEDKNYYGDLDDASQLSNSSDYKLKNNNNYNDEDEYLDMGGYYNEYAETKMEDMEKNRFFSMNEISSTGHSKLGGKEYYQNIDDDLLELENLFDQISLGSDLMHDRSRTDENSGNF
jgi:hypothetical protein